MLPDSKRCAACQETKPIGDFYADSKGSHTRRPWCKPCTSAKRKAAYQRNGGSDIPYKQVLQREYGMTLDDYNAKLRAQAHRCAVCRRAETAKSKSGETRRLSVDHDHVTGGVRGLLCHRCNVLVWAFEDNHTTLSAIVAYLDQWRESLAT